MQWYKLREDNSGIYDEIESMETFDCSQMNGIIGKLLAKRLLISGEEVEVENANINLTSHEDLFSLEIKEAIRNRIAVAAVDASVDKRYIAVYWVITTSENEPRCAGNIYSTKWISGQTPVAEGVRILNILREINKKTSHLELEDITVYSDMKKIINEVRYKIIKESQCVRETGATIIAIKKEIDNATITVELEYSNTKIR